MIQTYYALNNQTIYDVCLMTYGILDTLPNGQPALFKLIQDNNFGSVNNYPALGQSFAWDDTLVFNNQVSITNSLTNVNYATRSNSKGNIGYAIQSNGLPVNGNQIVYTTPPPPNMGTGKYDYYLVFNTDPRWSGGGLTFTDPYLVGKANYAIYAQQDSQFFSVNEGVDIHYNSVAGSFTILTPGFSLINSYYLVIYPNKYDTTIP